MGRPRLAAHSRRPTASGADGCVRWERLPWGRGRLGVRRPLANSRAHDSLPDGEPSASPPRPEASARVRADVETLPQEERRHVASAHLVFVALDAEGRPTEVAAVLAETPDERRRQAQARVRREQRLLRKAAVKRAGGRSRRMRAMTDTVAAPTGAEPTAAALRVRDASRRAPGARQFVRYAFYRVAPEWRRRPPEQRAAERAELAAVVTEMAEREGVILRSYSLVGTRGDADLMLWMVSDRLDELHQLAARINQTAIAGYLEQPYHYLAMTKRSMYAERHAHEDGAPQEGRSSRLIIAPSRRRYLFVYPFVKTRAWHRLSAEERQRQMNEHIAMGHRYPGVKINTTYSFGLDDQEFVVAFESDSVSDFLDLVQDMRASEASTHTVRDVPSFTCVSTPIEDALAALG